MTPETIVLQVLPYITVVVIGLVKLYINKKILANATTGIILPSNCGKSTIVSTFKEMYGEESNYVLIDIESEIDTSSLITDIQRKELETLKLSDSHIYESKLMTYSKIVFDDIAGNIKKSNKNKKLIVLASTKAIIKGLGIKIYYSFIPNSKLLKLITDAENVSVPFIKYTIAKINSTKKSTLTFNDFDGLFDLITTKLKIEKKK
jgi:hypothetical protein